MDPLRLSPLPEALAICRLPADASVPEWVWQGPLTSLTRSGEELSIVCAQTAVPAGVSARGGWRALKVEGPLDFDLVGILAGLTQPLAAAGIPVFALSTYGTDYLLVQSQHLERALHALASAGFAIDG